MTTRRDLRENGSTDPQRDDRYAEYLIAMENLCTSAELARLRVEVITTRGGRITGLVVPTGRADGNDQFQ
ncbi:MAG: hypothetical protein ACRDQH_07885 [Pseudonocardiaceae bacterium]